jgi:hypothetical protein
MLVLAFFFWGIKLLPLQSAQSLAGLSRGVPCARSFSSLLFPSAGDRWFKVFGDD